MNDKKTTALADILEQHIKGELTTEQVRERFTAQFSDITANDFAQAEQQLVRRGVADEDVFKHIQSFRSILSDIISTPAIQLEEWHPVRTYLREIEAAELLLQQSELLSQDQLSREHWLEMMKKLTQFETHLTRKQNQLYSILEKHNFDRPSKIMWTLDDTVADLIKESDRILHTGDYEAFLGHFQNTRETIRELIEMERSVLLPVSLEIIPQKEFYAMRTGDDEIGYFLISTPPPAPPTSVSSAILPDGFSEELAGLMEKYHLGNAAANLNVRQGKLSLEQLNLILRHLPVDLSYIDENELVCFYSDTKHRVFPRSPAVIGRDVKNCHPPDSVHVVKEIIEAFRAGTQDEAEFWLEMDNKFVYILYTAVRDEAGAFRGVLEMMQDVTHIRNLQGSNRLLSWNAYPIADTASKKNYVTPPSVELNPDTLIGDLIAIYPDLMLYLSNLNTKFKKLANPSAFKMVASHATLNMVARRGGMPIESLIQKIKLWIANHTKYQGEENDES